MESQQQNGQRSPQIEPRDFAAFNELDTFLGRAPLNRAEHQHVSGLMQHLVSRMEALQASLTATTAELAALKAEKAKQANSAAATEAIEAALRK